MKMVCDKAIRCPGTDFPIANFSSEKPDHEIFLFTGFGYPDPPGTVGPGDSGPGGGGSGCDPTCVVFSTSTTSVTDAETCATEAQTACVNCMPIETSSTTCTVTPVNPNPPAGPIGGGGVNPTNTPVIGGFAGFACAEEDYAFLLSVSGANVPIVLTVSEGSLPPGIDLGPTGLLSGNPNTAGFYSFTVTAIDSIGNTSSQDMTFTVLGITTDSVLPDGTIGLAYSQQLVGDGGANIFDITAGSLQTGLAMDEFGLISGTPITSGTTTFTVTVTDSFLNTCDKDFVLKVNTIPVVCPFSSLVWGAPTIGGTGAAAGLGASFSASASGTNPSPSSATIIGSVTYNGSAINCNLHIIGTFADIGCSASSGFGVNIFQDGNPIIIFPIDATHNPPGTYDMPFTILDTGGLPQLIQVNVHAFGGVVDACDGNASGSGLLTCV